MNILIVIDMQNDFINGALGTPEAVSILPSVKRKIEQRIKEGWKVIYTKDTHTEDYLNTQEGQKLPVIHCVKGTHGWEIHESLLQESCLIIEKPGFGSCELANILASEANLKNIELIGICTDICVITNALLLKARLPEVPISVDASCCAGVTPESHNNALDAMKMCQINIVNHN